MIDIFKKFLSTRLASEIAWVTAGNVFRTTCVFLGWIFLARALGPKQLGVFTFAFSVMNLMANLSELGMGVGIVKFVASENPGSEKAASLLRCGFWIRLILTSVLTLLLLLFAKFVTYRLMDSPALYKPLLIGSLGTIGASYFGYILSAYQSTKRFKAYGLLSCISGFILLLGFSILHFTSNMTPEFSLLVSAVALSVPALVGHISLRISLLQLPTKRNWSEAKNLMTFSKWVMAGSVCAMVIMQADTFILTRLSTLAEVGKFSAGSRFAMSVSVLSNSILTVLMPKFFSKSGNEHYNKLLKMILRLIPICICIFIIGFITSHVIITTAYGSDYSPSVPVFNILFGAFLLSIFTNLLNYLGFAMNNPKSVTINLFIQLIVLYSLGTYLVGDYGAIGMANAVLLSRICGLVFIVWIVAGSLKKWRFAS